MDPEAYRKEYAEVFEGDANWNSLKSSKSTLFTFDDSSTYIREPPWLYLDPVKNIKMPEYLQYLVIRLQQITSHQQGQ